MTKAVGIKELKNRLSEYLREVRSGVRIVVTDRQQVIAELKQPDSLSPQGAFSSLYYRWCAEGKLRPPGAKVKVIRESPLKNRAGLGLELLNEDRGR